MKITQSNLVVLTADDGSQTVLDGGLNDLPLPPAPTRDDYLPDDPSNFVIVTPMLPAWADAFTGLQKKVNEGEWEDVSDWNQQQGYELAVKDRYVQSTNGRVDFYWRLVIMAKSGAQIIGPELATLRSN